MNFSCFLFLFLCRREQNVVQNETIARRIGVHVQFRRRVADDVLVVLRVVAAEKSPKAVAEVAVDVTILVQGAIVAQHHHRRLHVCLVEGSSLPHKAFDKAFMALREHGRYRVPLGGEVKEQEIVVLFLYFLHTPLGDINV